MALAVQQIYPIAHLPLVLGFLWRLEIATIIDGLIASHPAHVLSAGRGVEALVLALLDGAHAQYKGGQQLEERGRWSYFSPGERVPRGVMTGEADLRCPLYGASQPGFSCRGPQSVGGLCPADPWLHQDTMTIARSGASEDEPHTPGAPRSAYGQSKDGRDDRTQVLLRLGVHGDGGIPLRLGVRDGNRSDRVETPVAIAECLALGLGGTRDHCG